MKEEIRIAPQSGPQQMFLGTNADICVYGGSAGGGKSWGLLLEPLRHVSKPKFRGVIFRRTYPQVTNPGGLWDESMKIYPLAGAESRVQALSWLFPSGARIKFAHLQHDGDEYNWQGSQICFIGFDELTHFTEQQFWYMLSRNRSLSGVRPYVRATTNPDADSWVATMLEWWIDQNTGYPIPERGGVVRWFIRLEGVIHWGDSLEELREKYGAEVQPKSFTFIPSSVFDNRILMEQDPGYLANLEAQTLVERERLLMGNWKVRPEAGKVFDRAWFEEVLIADPGDYEVRFWDFAATVKETAGDDPDYTATVKMRKQGNIYTIVHAAQRRLSPPDVDNWVIEQAKADKQAAFDERRATRYAVRWETEPGSAGKRDTYRLTSLLAGFDAGGVRPTGDKLTRAKPLAAQARVGNVKILRAPWNNEYLTHMHHQPDWPHDDLMDASSGAFNYLADASVSVTWGSKRQ